MLNFWEVHADTVERPPPQPFEPVTMYYPAVIDLIAQGDTATGSLPGTTTSANFFVAACAQGMGAGLAVVMSGQDTVAPADNTSPAPVVGLITAMQSPTLAVVQTSGEVVLGLSGLSPGAIYYLGRIGTLTAPPLDGVTYVQRVGTATSSTTLYLSLDGMVTKQNP